MAPRDLPMVREDLPPPVGWPATHCPQLPPPQWSGFGRITLVPPDGR